MLEEGRGSWKKNSFSDSQLEVIGNNGKLVKISIEKYEKNVRTARIKAWNSF